MPRHQDKAHRQSYKAFLQTIESLYLHPTKMRYPLIPISMYCLSSFVVSSLLSLVKARQLLTTVKYPDTIAVNRPLYLVGDQVAICRGDSTTNGWLTIGTLARTDTGFSNS